MTPTHIPELMAVAEVSDLPAREFSRAVRAAWTLGIVGVGSSRVACYYDTDLVLKIPLTRIGVEECKAELRIGSMGAPFLPTLPERVTVDGGATVWGVSMPRVGPANVVGPKGWERLIDGLQVGLLNGALWAYDFGGLTDKQAVAVQRAWAAE